MSKKILKIMIVAVIVFAVGYAYADSPNFSAAIYADGEVWATKGTTSLPAPNEHNFQSFDGLFQFINSNNPLGQLPVSEAGPGNPDYNGGRWYLFIVEWTDAGFDYFAPDPVPILTSYDDILYYEDIGYLEVSDPEVQPFQCPLLPVKD